MHSFMSMGSNLKRFGRGMLLEGYSLTRDNSNAGQFFFSDNHDSACHFDIISPVDVPTGFSFSIDSF